MAAAARQPAGTLLALVAMVVVVVAMVLVTGAEAGGRRVGPQLERLIAEDYGENRTGAWHCTPRRTGEHMFEFDAPELPRLQCVVTGHKKLGGGGGRGARQKPRVLAADALYVVLRGAGKPRRGTFACAACERRWVPARASLERQTALRQCRLGAAVRGVTRGGHPLAGAGGGGAHSRADGVRCYLAVRKGCDRGFVWCHGACCRPEALFYYPELQKDAGVGGRLLVDHEAQADSDSRRLLEALRRRLQEAAAAEEPGRRSRGRGGGRAKTLGSALRDATDEQRRRFFTGDA